MRRDYVVTTVVLLNCSLLITMYQGFVGWRHSDVRLATLLASAFCINDRVAFEKT